jgi:predicted metalloprotease with PDZ domain
LVGDVTMGGWAQMAGLRVDDLVLGIRGKNITDTESFASIMSETMKKRPKVVDIFIRRGVQTHFVFIEPDWAKLTVSKT